MSTSKLRKSDTIGTHLEPAYSGVLTTSEVADIQKFLRKYGWLRVWWGFHRNAKHFSGAKIRQVALFGHPDDASENRKIITGQAKCEQVACTQS